MRGRISLTISVVPQYLDWQNNTDARLGSMEEGWHQRGNWYQKSASIFHGTKEKRKIKLSAKIVRCALEKMFSQPQGWFRINLDDEESYTVTSVKKKPRECIYCSATPQHGKELCKKCEELPEEARIIVGNVNPTLDLVVDERYRWISGKVHLSAR